MQKAKKTCVSGKKDLLIKQQGPMYDVCMHVCIMYVCIYVYEASKT